MSNETTSEDAIKRAVAYLNTESSESNSLDQGTVPGLFFLGKKRYNNQAF